METQKVDIQFNVLPASGNIVFPYITPRSAEEASTLLGLHDYTVITDTSEMDYMLLCKHPALGRYESVVAVWNSPDGVFCAEMYSSAKGLYNTVPYTLLLIRDWDARFFLVKELPTQKVLEQLDKKPL